MTIILSQADYGAMLQKDRNPQPSVPDHVDVTWPYPAQLGEGCIRKIHLRQGLELEIASYRLHQNIVIEVPEREHPLEYEVSIVQEIHHPRSGFHPECYFFSGSGLAEAGINETCSGWQVFDVSFHLEPTLLCAWMGDRWEDAPATIKEWVQPRHQSRYTYEAHQTMAMQAVLQQILSCPYAGITQQIYLESKVWELIALHLDQALKPEQDMPQVYLKPDDVERLHYARDILKQQLSAPPSLRELARQVGLNEFALKQGFRHLFGTTAFGCLNHYRLEHAKALLEDGNFNVTEVAHRVGFANRGHFAAAFRKKFGVNPKAYAIATQREAN
jgi:AraC family transcriptional regulator, transcriptional activator of the genes for pyochelin and ferripyochelin receptors